MELQQLRPTLMEIARTTPHGAVRRARITSTVTKALKDMWHDATHHDQDNRAAGMALVAVGSLGRGDMGAMSDLDLLLVYDGNVADPAAVEEIANRLWYPIWDAGIDLDHSVRSLNQCRKVASHDITAAVGMLSMTHLCGDKEVASRASAAVLADWRSAARTRLTALRASAKVRQERFGEVAYLVEPDIKEARGGLRDALLLDALAASWLTDRSHGALDDAIAELLDVRDAIHVVTGRHANTLLAADRDEVAQVLQLNDGDQVTAHIAAAGRRVSFELDVTFRRAMGVLSGGQGISRTLVIRGRRSAPRLRYVAPDVVELAGELALAPPDGGVHDPLVALRIAAASAKSGLPISGSAVPVLSATADPPTPWSPEARGLFETLLSSGSALIDVWEVLDVAGLPSRWLRGWEGVRNRPQRAPVHRHTVDRHLIEVVSRTRLWKSKVDSPVTLMLAALLHDIGKQQGIDDHSVGGGELVPQILEPLGYGANVIADVRILVEQHLMLSQLATTQDPQDPEVIAKVTQAVQGRRDILEMLRALTEADASSLGSAAWTRWRERLVDELFHGALRTLSERPTGS